ncbi:MAG: N-acetyl-D-Glu racemase DgcA [Pseudomonadota bacterium]
MTRRLEVAVETWPIAGSFSIARGARTEAVVVTATITDGDAIGRGECVPYARYEETVDGVAELIGAQAQPIAEGLDRAALQSAMPAGAARNALDCALWDLEAKRSGERAATSAGYPAPRSVETAYTISLAAPDVMAEQTRKVAHRPLLKVKLGAEGDPERIAAIRAAAPETTLIVDANEGWSSAVLAENIAACETARVALVEQPVPAGQDDLLRGLSSPVLFCADESAHTSTELDDLVGCYDAVNIKLDKTGGLTEALIMREAARARDFKIMVGCMLATSLAMAPAVLLAQDADFVDLDGPLLLAKDRLPGLIYDGATVSPPDPALWG